MACDQVILSNTGTSAGTNNMSVIDYGIGQAFTMGSISRCLCKSRHYINITSGTSLTLDARVYACTGTPGTDGKPTGNALTTSTEIVYTSNSSASWKDFIFSTPYRLIGETNYCIGVYIKDKDGSGSFDHHYTNNQIDSNYFNGNTVHPDRDAFIYIYYDPNINCGTGWTNTINGVITPSKINEIAVANISKVNGV